MLDTVWDGRPPASAASTLYAYIARLRKVLGSAGGALRRVSGGYVLDVPAGQVDVWRFDAAVGRALGLTGTATANQVVQFLDEALSWSRGPLLEGLSDDAPLGADVAHQVRGPPAGRGRGPGAGAVGVGPS